MRWCCVVFGSRCLFREILYCRGNPARPPRRHLSLALCFVCCLSGEVGAIHIRVGAVVGASSTLSGTALALLLRKQPAIPNTVFICFSGEGTVGGGGGGVVFV